MHHAVQTAAPAAAGPLGMARESKEPTTILRLANMVSLLKRCSKYPCVLAQGYECCSEAQLGLCCLAVS